jgi:hypothetical protein
MPRGNDGGGLVPIGGPGVVAPVGVRVRFHRRLGYWPSPGGGHGPRYLTVELPTVCQFYRTPGMMPEDTVPPWTFWQPESGHVLVLQYVPQRFGRFIRRPVRTPDLGLRYLRFGFDGSLVGRVAVDPPTAEIFGDDWRTRGPAELATMADLYVTGQWY